MRDHEAIAQVRDTSERDLDVIVVGAGISGLCAARGLERAGRDVLVLEATERVGGKMRTERLGPDHVDLGAHWIGPGQDRGLPLSPRNSESRPSRSRCAVARYCSRAADDTSTVAPSRCWVFR